ncbi:MAG: nucleotide exchange factor GrpE [Candidatus Micrarchaeota archaeon]|nr:nucleotide exchange factor GrpE [Candidatus Micrarchaeota archaeon]
MENEKQKHTATPAAKEAEAAEAHAHKCAGEKNCACEKKIEHEAKCAHGHDENSCEHAPKEAKPCKHEPNCSCEGELAKLGDSCLRIAAEFDNYKKRTAKEKEALALHSEMKLILRLLPAYEEIAMAEREVAKIKEAEVAKGALMVLSKLQQAFEKEGLLQMKLKGEKYDPFRHEVALREDSGAPEGTIVRVIRNGYLYKGEVLQHALVSVSSGKKPGEKQEKADETDVTDAETKNTKGSGKTSEKQ